MLDQYGCRVKILASRGRIWYVENTTTGKRFKTNKNNLKPCLEESNTSSKEDDEIAKRYCLKKESK